MHAATFTAVVVLPTPPFWLAIAYTVPMRGTLAPEGTLASDPHTPGKPGRRLGDLFVDVQAMVQSACVRLGVADLAQTQAQQPGGIVSGRLSLHVATAPPVDEQPTGTQQRRGVLEHDRLRRERAGHTTSLR